MLPTRHTAEDVLGVPMDHRVLIDVPVAVYGKDRCITGIAGMMVVVGHI
jgi:hypothetical protein